MEVSLPHFHLLSNSRFHAFLAFHLPYQVLQPITSFIVENWSLGEVTPSAGATTISILSTRLANGERRRSMYKISEASQFPFHISSVYLFSSSPAHFHVQAAS
ncbi:hypothetical protein F2Q70_00038105 [Brassica cretica]|uniref:Uncharacterized protein n=1 Tax=Brassica cretica TaxID=69181 RepID=A0A8S9K428_BRACR|nr:hypothetical protein F2Q70_00038105 [Brassica cretica]